MSLKSGPCAAPRKHAKISSMMTIKTVLSLGLFLLLPAMASAAQAGNLNSAGGLAQSFVEAINSKNQERRLALLHSRSKACINVQSQPYYDWIFSRQAKHVIPDAKYRSLVEPLVGAQVLAADGKSDYPIRPTHQLQIDFDTGPNNSTSIVLLIVRDGASWYEVLPCPRPETIASVRTAEMSRAEHDARVKVLIGKLADPLRGEIIALARKGQRIDAIKKYREASGEGLSIAKSVVDTLVPIGPSAK